jgi:hypothetical protein
MPPPLLTSNLLVRNQLSCQIPIVNLVFKTRPCFIEKKGKIFACKALGTVAELQRS